jgi:hypothetical protein
MDAVRMDLDTAAATALTALDMVVSLMAAMDMAVMVATAALILMDATIK